MHVSVTVPAALQQHKSETAHAKKATESEEERRRNQQQRQKRAPGDSEETASFDGRDSDFSLAGRYWSVSRHVCAVLDRFTGSSVSSRFGNVKDDSAPGPIKTKPATEVKLPRLSQALNNVLRTAHFLVFMTGLQVTEYVAAPPRPLRCTSPCSQPPSAAVAEKQAASPIHHRTSKPAPFTQGRDLPGLFQRD